MTKPAFSICDNKIISVFVFAIHLLQASSYIVVHLLWLCSPVCVRPGRNPRRPVLSQRDSYKRWFNRDASDLGNIGRDIKHNCPPPPSRGGGRLLVNCVPMREQRIAKLTLNSVFKILKLITLFTVSSQKVTLSNVVNFNAYSLSLQHFENL